MKAENILILKSKSGYNLEVNCQIQKEMFYFYDQKIFLNNHFDLEIIIKLDYFLLSFPPPQTFSCTPVCLLSLKFMVSFSLIVPYMCAYECECVCLIRTNYKINNKIANYKRSIERNYHPH